MEPAKHDTRYQTKIREKEAEKGAKGSEKEIEKGAGMEEREITSVEDVEELLTPMEINKPTQQEETRGDLSVRQFWELMKKKMDKNKEEIKEYNKTLLKQINEERRQHREERKKIMDKGFESINDNFKKMNEKLDRFNEKLSETLDNGFKKVNETLDRVSEDSKETLNENKEPVDKKVEESKKETELKEDKSILLSENKNNRTKAVSYTHLDVYKRQR